MHQAPDNEVLKLALTLGVDVRREHGGYQEGWLQNSVWYGVHGGRAVKIGRADIDAAYNLLVDVGSEFAKKADEINHSGEADISIGQVLSLSPAWTRVCVDAFIVRFCSSSC